MDKNKGKKKTSKSGTKNTKKKTTTKKTEKTSKKKKTTNGNDPIIVKKQDYEKKFREMRDISLNCSYNK